MSIHSYHQFVSIVFNQIRLRRRNHWSETRCKSGKEQVERCTDQEVEQSWISETQRWRRSQSSKQGKTLVGSRINEGQVNLLYAGCLLKSQFEQGILLGWTSKPVVIGEFVEYEAWTCGMHSKFIRRWKEGRHEERQWLQGGCHWWVERGLVDRYNYIKVCRLTTDILFN